MWLFEILVIKIFHIFADSRVLFMVFSGLKAEMIKFFFNV